MNIPHGDKFAIPPPPPTWGDKVYEFRQVHHLTQAELAAALGVTVQSVSNWESGRSTPWDKDRATYLERMLALATTRNAALQPLTERL